MRESFQHLVLEINSAIDSQNILVAGINFQTTVCLGSDLKILQVLISLQSASSKFPCPFRHADSKDKSDLDLPSRKFNEPPLKRTRENLSSDCDALTHGVSALQRIGAKQVVKVPPGHMMHALGSSESSELMTKGSSFGFFEKH